MTKVIVCGCATHQRVSYGKIRTFLSLLPENFDVELVDDLCGLAVCDKEKMAELANADYLVACYPRAVKALFEFSGYENLAFNRVNLREMAPKEALAQLGVTEFADNGKQLNKPKWKDEWTPWNPVIDYERCIHCGKCADFCLFGVYEKNAGKVTVSNPKSCKTNCPACAKICPESAIIFPKYEKSPINGGVELEENLPLDPSEVRKKGTYQTLASRRRNKRKLLRDDL